MLTAERAREALDYDLETGVFRHRRREGARTGWNTRYAGAVTGCKSPYGYLVLAVDDKTYLAHRVAWLYVHGEWPAEVDHVNGVRHDNRLVNLRLATRTQNNANAKLRRTNTSGFKGVSYARAYKRWRAELKKNGEYKLLAYFHTPEAAHAAYAAAAEKHFGEFARFV